MRQTMRAWVWAIATATAAGAADDAAIRDVREGRQKVAEARWWGFNPEDATAALQAAIDSGAEKVIVSDMGTPWIVTPIRLAGRQELVLEKGVVVQAKRGAFHGTGDALFTATLKTNVTLSGYGATLRMWKADYDGPAYTHAEWRHALSLLSCTGVRVSGLTLADSGGDGVYLGSARRGVPNRDVTIKDVVCTNNYRQGVSVITAENLLLEDCRFLDTGGTAPEAGIDFEPNRPDERLANCVLRRCVSEGNRGSAYAFWLNPLADTSTPVAVRFEDCRSRGGPHALAFGVGASGEHAPVRGRAEFVRCVFEGSEGAGIQINNKPVSAVRLRFEDCVVADTATNRPEEAPIALRNTPESTEDFGGLDFVNCTVRDPLERLPLAYRDSAGVRVSDVTGAIAVERGGRRTEYALTRAQLDAWLPEQAYKDVPRFETKGIRYEPAFPAAAPGGGTPAVARQRGAAEYLLWAEAGQDTAFSVRIQKVGRSGPASAAVRVFSPAGAPVLSADVPGATNTPLAFRASAAGAYRISIEAGSATSQVLAPGRRVCLYSGRSSFHLLATTGTFYFRVPAGIAEFGVKVLGGGETERVKATLADGTGRTVAVQDNIEQLHQFLGAPADRAAGGIWSLTFARPSDGVLEDFFVQLQGVPPVLAGRREGLLVPRAGQ